MTNDPRKRRTLPKRADRQALLDEQRVALRQTEVPQQHSAAVAPSDMAGSGSFETGSYGIGDTRYIPSAMASVGTTNILGNPSILKSRLGYQNPITIASDLRMMQVQASVSVGDTDQDALAMAQALRSYGGSTLVASSGGPMISQFKMCDALHATVELNRRGPVVDQVNRSRIKRLAQEFRANIVVARSRAPALAAQAAAKSLRLPFVTHFGALYDIQSERQFKNSAVLASGDVVVVPSRFLAGHVRQFYDLQQRRLVVIPRGVDTQKFSRFAVSQRSISALRDRLGLVQNRPIAVMAGRLSFWKGQHLFVEAIKRLESQNIYGLIFAYGSEKKDYARDLRRLIERWNIGNRIRIVSEPHDMAVVYGMADQVVSASVEPEGFARSIAEAMAIGKPCIAPNHGSSPEQIDHHETGWLYAPGNVEALTQAMQEALSLTKEQNTNLSNWACEAAREHHDIRKICDMEIDLALDQIAL